MNCHAALRRIQEVKNSSIWVDAICINQKDDDEKSRQIPLMRDIYTLANEVVFGSALVTLRPLKAASAKNVLVLV